MKALQTFEARELPLKTVTVFTDRAEVKRVFKVELAEGLTDVVVENVTSTIDSDSIRIDGHGTATIHEVQFKRDYATNTEVDSPKAKELAEQLEKIQGKLASKRDLKAVYEKRIESLNNMVEKLHVQTEQAEKFGAAMQEHVESLFTFHEKKCVEIQALIRNAEAEIKEMKAEARKLEQKIAEMRPSVVEKRSIVVTLENAAKSEVEVVLTYQVRGASWTPSYDVRITTDPVATTKAQMKLYYFGNIRQNTGEEWQDVELMLSTAQPHLAGPLPKLGTLRAKIHNEPQGGRTVQTARRSTGGWAPRRQLETKAARRSGAAVESEHDEDDEEDDEEDDDDDDASALGHLAATFAHQTMRVEKQSLSTTFLVPQAKTIPSDSSDHKVTIVCLEFEPLLHLDCVPSKNTNVFLTASILNTSDYPLLKGFASIYVDTSFASKVYVQCVPTGDKFDCPIGIDSSLKVQYKPLNTFTQQTGLMTKTASVMHEQKILVKNTKAGEPVLLTIREQVPKSTDEKIKVKLYSPDVKALIASQSLGTNEDIKTLKLPYVGPRLNADHNLEWTVLLSEGEERELVIKWSVESPANETVEYEED